MTVVQLALPLSSTLKFSVVSPVSVKPRIAISVGRRLWPPFMPPARQTSFGAGLTLAIDAPTLANPRCHRNKCLTPTPTPAASNAAGVRFVANANQNPEIAAFAQASIDHPACLGQR